MADQAVVDVVLDNLNFCRQKHGYRICGFVVMPDHCHFLLIMDVNRLSRILRDMKSMIARRVIDYWKATPSACKNLEMLRLPQMSRGLHEFSLWQPGNWPVMLETTGQIETRLDYMHMNPVSAGLVQRAVDWPWSSAHWYLRCESVGIRLDTDWAL